MAEFQNFRSALGGFNREDVVHYIEYINNKHAAQLNQLKTEVQTLQAELNEQHQAAQQEALLSAQLAEAQARIQQLEQDLEEARKPVAPVVIPVAQPEKTSDELEAYRRAERAEHRAAERVAQLYDQANAALADAAARTDVSAQQVSQLADALNQQLQQLLVAISAGKNTMLDAAAAMYAVRPLSNKE